MRIHSVTAKNFRALKVLREMRLGPLATIVGRNDVGKSSVLRALDAFFDEKSKLDESDVHSGADANEDVIVELSFTDLPTKISLEDGVDTTLAEERLLDEKALLTIRKTFPRTSLDKPTIQLIVHDFNAPAFAQLTQLKERELNARCQQVGIDATRSGRGVTNKGKRDSIRTEADKRGIERVTSALQLSSRDELWKAIRSLLPDFVLFEAETKVGVGETTFQSQFRPIVKSVAEQPEAKKSKEEFEAAIKQALQREIDSVFERLRRHTDAVTALSASPDFAWEKAVSFDILGKDLHGVEMPLDRRGSGIRRLLMVAYFEYLAEKGHDLDSKYVFAVEEPENSLHPSLQRELLRSFRKLAEDKSQVIVTSHSPVFAGESPMEDLTLVVRNNGIAEAKQVPELELEEVARELGIEPSDQITGLRSCIFVEGPDDVQFWRQVISKLHDAGKLGKGLEEEKNGFLIFGGDNLKHWINLRALKKLNRPFIVLLDSDRGSEAHPVACKKMRWKKACEAQGGQCFILRKREIENYIHKDAIARAGLPAKPFDDWTDMKQEFGPNVHKLICGMSADEVLESCRYQQNGETCYELVEIATKIVGLAQ